MGRDAGGGEGDDRSEAEPEAAAGDDRGPQDVRGEGAIGADQAEPGESGRGQESADDHKSAGRKTVTELDGDHGTGDQREGERQEHHPGPRRSRSEDLLEVEGREVEGGGHGRADQEHVGVRARDRAVGEQPEPDQRFAGGGQLDTDERGQQYGGDRQVRQGDRRGPRVLVRADDAEHQQGHARRDQDGTEHVRTATASGRRSPGDAEPCQGQRASRHRHVHEHDPPPAGVLGEHAARQDS